MQPQTEHSHHEHSHTGEHSHSHDHSDNKGVWGWITSALHLHPHSHHAEGASFIETEEGIRVVWLALAALAITSVLQVIIVLASGSVALFADTAHNIVDGLNSIPLLIACMVEIFNLSLFFPSRMWGAV